MTQKLNNQYYGGQMRSRIINFTIIVALALFSMMHFLEIAKATKHITHRLSSISEFKECVNFQNHVPLDMARVIWDVQSASCYVVLKNGRFITVPNFIKELEDYTFEEGGL